jgi:hypothetical protein
MSHDALKWSVWREVTPEQLAEGYLEKIDDKVYERKFTVIGRIANSQNYFVVDPEWERNHPKWSIE